MTLLLNYLHGMQVKKYSNECLNRSSHNNLLRSLYFFSGYCGVEVSVLLFDIYQALTNLVKNNYDALALPFPGQWLGLMPSLSSAPESPGVQSVCKN